MSEIINISDSESEDEIVEITDELSDGAEVGVTPVFESVFVGAENSETKRKNDPLGLAMQTEILLDHDPELYQCDYCLKNFKWKSYIERHVKTHIKKYCCKACNIEFTYKSQLENHMLIHRRKVDIGDSQAAEVDYDHEIFKVAEESQTGPKITQKYFFMVTDPEGSEINETTYDCELCDFSANRLHSLNIHIAKRHDETEKQYECEDCHKKFKKKWNWISHIGNIHSKGDLFNCSECSSTFVFYHQLKKHMKFHGKNAVVKCEKCPAVFEDRRKWRNHLLSHHRVKQILIPKGNVEQLSKCKNPSNRTLKNSNFLQCKICLKYFMNIDDLNYHLVNIHEAIQCDLCFQCFASEDLERHKMEAHSKSEIKSEIEIEEPTMNIM